MTTEQTAQPFEKCASGGQRRQLAKRFTAYLDTRDTEKHAFVANLNGSWGTGKTYFVEEWQKLLKAQGYIAIKIDAWESDYLEDSLSILIAELLEQIYEQDNRDDFTEEEKKVARGIISLGKAIAPSIIKGALATWVWGEETNKELIAVFDKATDSLNEINTDKAKTNHGAFADEAFRNHKLHKSFTKQFKEEIGKLLKQVNEAKKEPKEKTYIFVDELDRCRPTYAIEMLETVKHLFDIPNLIFVLSTDTEQLEHSIKAVYGQDFDSREYLSRFFNQRMVLPEPDLLAFIKAEKAFEGLDFTNLKSFPQISRPNQLQDAFCIFCELNKRNLSFRTIKYLIDVVGSLIVDEEVYRYQFCIYLLLAAVFGDNLYTMTKPQENLPAIEAETALIYSYDANVYNGTYSKDNLKNAIASQRMSAFINSTISNFKSYVTNPKNIGAINQWPIFQSKEKRNHLIEKIFPDIQSCFEECQAIKQREDDGIEPITTNKDMIELIRRTSTIFEEG